MSAIYDPARALCYCHHLQREHEADGDFDEGRWVMYYGCCAVVECNCPQFRDVDYDDPLAIDQSAHLGAVRDL
jgi:hypothetical protein